MRFKDKIALITGAGQGLGEGIALKLASEGADVVINDVNETKGKEVVKKIEDLGRKAIFVKADISNGQEVKVMAREALNTFGRVDILVNNAGIVRAYPTWEFPEEEWDLVININLKGTFLVCKALVPQMIERRQGKIINISSKSGKKGGIWMSAYASSKSGVIGFTQSLALELAPFGINVNAVCPGVIFTPLWDQLDEVYSKKLGIPKEKVRSHYVEKIPLGRPQTVEDIANVVVFLASDEASFMTGQAINVTGGQEMH